MFIVLGPFCSLGVEVGVEKNRLFDPTGRPVACHFRLEAKLLSCASLYEALGLG